jgi:hypothetical protein
VFCEGEEDIRAIRAIRGERSFLLRDFARGNSISGVLSIPIHFDRGLRGFHGSQGPELKPQNTPTTRKGFCFFRVFRVVRGSHLGHPW